MLNRIDEFIIEAREHLGIIEDSLLATERQTGAPDSTSRIDRCFRSIHSIKGDAGFLGLKRINELAHAMESFLEGSRQSISAAAVETLLTARDRLAVLVDNTRQSDEIEIDDLVSRLRGDSPESIYQLFEVDLAERNTTYPGGLSKFIRKTIQEQPVLEGQIQLESCDLKSGLPKGPVRWIGRTNGRRSGGLIPTSSNARHQLLKIDLSEWSRSHHGLCGIFGMLSGASVEMEGKLEFPTVDLRMSLPVGPIIWAGNCLTSLSASEFQERISPQIYVPTSIDHDSRSDFSLTKSIDGAGSTRIQPADAAKAVSGVTKASTSLLPAESEKPTTLRIQVELLDRMMTLVGELTLVRNQSLLAFADEDGEQRAIIQRLNSVTSELQDVTMRARMQPVNHLFNKFPRMVRDLARQLGKQVELELQAREVEMDKTILEQLSDPLMHLIRNSVDHGIERPEERVAKGKSPVGRIVLSATHEDGQVHIQIRDDGKGIDPEAVKVKALALRLKSEAELERMSPRELNSLILLPGFSTATAVTEVSGRGVGMDVVKTNIEQLEGTLNIDSVIGLGCSFVLRLPLTLAIIPCLIVTVNGDRYAVPQRDLEEAVCLHPKSPGRIERAYDTEVYRLRDKLLPIVRLADVLARKKPFSDKDKAEILAKTTRTEALTKIEYILVLKLGGQRFGLVVDDVRGTQEVVVKPMHSSMKRVGIFAGATIMGDGRVALITDAQGIVEHARISFESAKELATKTNAVRDATEAHRVLIFEYGPQEQFALPLIQIRRIEMVSKNRIEKVGDDEFVSVDGVSTRILRLNRVLPVSGLEQDPALLSLILPKFVKEPMGILVSRIVDTESLALDLQQHPGHDPGILGTAIVRDRLTLFLELHRLSEKLFGIDSTMTAASARSVRHSKRLLLIDDTAFFREVVKRYLVAEGHEITTAIHGADALAKLDAGNNFDLIVSDIEMPVMDGWEFAREARRRGITTPMLALTSLSGVEYEVKAKQCGYDSYEVKLDHDRLVKKVGKLLAAIGMSS